MTPQQTFLSILQQVIGSALEGAAYRLEESPMQQARGLFRFYKILDPEKSYAFIEFQMLHHSDMSRFRLNLIRTDQRQEYTLSRLIWEVYGVQALPEVDYWWVYRQDLPQQLYEAGRLLFGYGVPWLEGQQK